MLPASTFISVRLVQIEKALAPTVKTELGTVIDVNFLQFRKATSATFVTKFGIVKVPAVPAGQQIKVFCCLL